MATYYQVVNDCEHLSCGHRHRSVDTAVGCVKKVVAKRQIAGSATVIAQYVDGDRRKSIYIPCLQQI